MDAALLNPSKYIKATDFQGKDVTVTLKSVKLEKLIREDNTEETKGVVFFHETGKGWVLNVTNVKALVAMWGRETDDWVNKRVTLYPEPSDLSESGFAIRVRGSPDIDKPITFALKLARKKPKTVRLLVTGQQQRPAQNGNGGRGPQRPAQQQLAPQRNPEPGIEEPPPGWQSDPNEPPLLPPDEEQRT